MTEGDFTFMSDTPGRAGGNCPREVQAAVLAGRWNWRQFMVAGLIAILFAGLFAGYAQAAQYEVEVTGVGFIQGGDVAAARDRAIKDAQVRALEKAVGITVDARTALHRSLLVDDTILTRTKGVVRDYKVVAEGPGEFGLYSVTLKALVDTVELADSLLKAAGDKKVLLLFREHADGKAAGSRVLLEELAVFFGRAGFETSYTGLPAGEPLLLDKQRIRAIAGESGSDVIAVAELATHALSCATVNFCSGLADGHVGLYNGKTGEEILEKIALLGQKGFGNTRAAADRDALQKGAASLLEKVSAALFKTRQRSFRVVVKNLPDHAAYRSLRRNLETLRWVSEVREDTVGYHPVKSVFFLKFSREPKLLAGMLDKMGRFNFLGRTGVAFVMEARDAR